MSQFFTRPRASFGVSGASGRRGANMAKRGRRPKLPNDRKAALLQIRLTESEKGQLWHAAKMAGVKPSKFVRRAIETAVREVVYSV